MNKQSMWFLTLFSLILVLSVYYITMPNELLLTNNSNFEVENVNGEVDEKEEVNVTIEQSEAVVVYNANLDETRQNMINEFQSVMLDITSTVDEKNEAYEQIQYLNDIIGKEEKIEQKIKEIYGVDNYVEINNSSIKVIAAKSEHDIKLANRIMSTVQGYFNNKMYITVKFET